jgi:sporulation protein YlmC with PRC-barrel domain
VDPKDRSLTHLVAEVKDGRTTWSRLVPVDLVDHVGDEVALSCTFCEFRGLEPATEVQSVESPLDQQPDLSTMGPYYGLAGGGAHSSQVEHRWVAFDRVPEGDVELTPRDHAYTSDGKIGKIHGVLVDPENYAITHVLLDEGHLWNKKEVAIPMDVVARVGEGIDVELSKKDVRDLPSTQ